jgi:hypothetical protein
MLNGVKKTESVEVVTGIEKVAQIREAIIPKKICPIDFKCEVSSNKNSRNSAKISRAKIYDPMSEEMVYGGTRANYGFEWEPDCDDKSSHVIIDMGVDTAVTHISIMGKLPCVRTFPDYYKDSPKIGHICGKPVENIILIMTNGRGKYGTNYNAESDGEWVTEFDLYARFDHRSKWIKIGTYTGNVDPYSERLHNIEKDLVNQRFRYLKFVSIACHNSIAMKVDVFGLASGIQVDDKIDRSHLIYTTEIPTRTISKKHGNHYLRDGVSCGDWYSCQIAKDDKRNDKRDKMNYIKNELKEYVDDKKKYIDTYCTGSN